MPLFEFDLMPVEEIVPWGEPDKLNLSWFALTLGRFRMPVGDQVLYRYKAGAFPDMPDSCDADYQIATIARDILAAARAGLAPLPPFFEALALDTELLGRLYATSFDDDSDDDSDWDYDSWRWRGERKPWTNYFVAGPEFYFVRIGDRIHVRWDNRSSCVDHVPIWEATHGSYEVPVAEFSAECRDFSDRLLAAMLDRISSIESGSSHPQVAVSIESLRKQHEAWRQEFSGSLGPKPPDIPWEEAEKALRHIAATCGIALPA